MAVQLEFLKSILSDGGSLCGDGKQMGFGVDGHLNKVGSAEALPAGGCSGTAQSAVKVTQNA